MTTSSTRSRRFKKYVRPPGPVGIPLLGSSLDIRKDTLGFFDSARAFGDLYSFELMTPSGKLLGYAVSKPDHVRHVLKDNYKNYRKSGSYDRLSSALGDGLLTSDGELWRRQRRLAQPAFHRRRLALLADVISHTAADTLEERWAATAPGPVNMNAEMSRLTLAVVGRALFSTDLGGVSEDVGKAVEVFLAHVSRRIKAPVVLPESFPTPGNRLYQKALSTLDSVVYGVISERRSSGEDAGDLLSMLIAATDEETGRGMTDRQLRDEVMTMIVAGHETTATALTWAWYLLSRNVAVRDKLFAEVDRHLDGRSPNYEDLDNLRYTNMVFRETLRLYPPAWMIARRLLEDDEIGGYRIPAGARVAISPYITHRNPAIWEDPLTFNPERFSPEKPAAALSKEFSWYPFGGGPRQCIGKNFALMEGVLLLATISQKYRLDLVPGTQVEPEASVTLRPRVPIPMSLHPRSS